jgi:hypothetical protein
MKMKNRIKMEDQAAISIGEGVLTSCEEVISINLGEFGIVRPAVSSFVKLTLGRFMSGATFFLLSGVDR